MSFNNKVVLVTGGSSGIGAATAIHFAKEGADVAIVGRNEAKLKAVAEKINNFGKKPLVLKADISNEDETKTLVDKTVAKFGKLDVLINNAGILRYGHIIDDNLIEVYDEIMNTNLRSTVLLTNLAAPHLVKTKGNIVMISSIAGTSPQTSFGTGFASYCTSKAGMEHFSRVAAVELAQKGVRVNIVSPGPVETDIISISGGESNWNKFAEKTALKVLTMPEEVADVILFLASDKARSITGANFTIDAGFRLLN